MNTSKTVIQALAAAAANHYRLMGADEDSNRLVDTMRIAAQAYQTATDQPVKVLEQAWAMVTAEKEAAEQELPLTSTTPDPYDPADTESICTALLEIAPQLESPDTQQAVQTTISYLKDYAEGCS